MLTRENQSLVTGALLGGLVGAAAMLMLTPMSGEDMRGRMMHGLPFLNGQKKKKKSSKRTKKAKVHH